MKTINKQNKKDKLSLKSCLIARVWMVVKRNKMAVEKTKESTTGLSN